MKTQLPQKITAPIITVTSDGTNHSILPRYLTPEAKAINQLIDYLKEREEESNIFINIPRDNNTYTITAKTSEREEPAPTPVVEEWPCDKNEYFFVNSRGEINEGEWTDNQIDYDRRAFNNVFRTRAEAEAKLAKITKVLGE